MWSIGCIAAELFIGKPIFPGKDTLNQIEQIVKFTTFPTEKDIATLQSDYGHSILAEAKKKLERGQLTKVEPEQILKHDSMIFYQAVDFVKKVLVFNIQTRANIDILLNHSYVSEWRQKDIQTKRHLLDDIQKDVTLGGLVGKNYVNFWTNRSELRTILLVPICLLHI